MREELRWITCDQATYRRVGSPPVRKTLATHESRKRAAEAASQIVGDPRVIVGMIADALIIRILFSPARCISAHRLASFVGTSAITGAACKDTLLALAVSTLRFRIICHRRLCARSCASRSRSVMRLACSSHHISRDPVRFQASCGPQCHQCVRSAIRSRQLAGHWRVSATKKRKLPQSGFSSCPAPPIDRPWRRGQSARF